MLVPRSPHAPHPAPGPHVATDGDCDDTVATVFPAAPELCDDLDNDCDLAVDELLDTTWYQDLDADGFGSTVAVTDCAFPVGYTARCGRGLRRHRQRLRRTRGRRLRVGRHARGAGVRRLRGRS